MIASREAEVPPSGRGARPDAAARERGRAERLRARSGRSGAGVILLRQGLAAVAGVLTMLSVARSLGVHNFGILAGGTAAFGLTIGLSDAGFSLLLAGQLAARPQDETQTLVVALRAQRTWSLGLAALLVAVGAGTMGSRGLVMVVLAPAVALGGATVGRQVVAIRGRSAPLALVEVMTTVLLCATTVVLAIRHEPVVLIAANISIWTCLGALPALVGARRLLRRARATQGEALRFARAALPLGLACAIPCLSLLLDLALLGWLTAPAAVGRYAAALRILLFVVAVPGVLLAGQARRLGGSGGASNAAAAGAAAYARTFLLVAVPLAAAVALLARPLVRDVLGTAYLGAVPLLRELMVAALLSVVAAIAGVLAISVGLARRLLLAGCAGTVAGVVTVVALAPRHGATAAVWAAIASQGLIAAGGLVSLSRAVAPKDLLRHLIRGAGTPAPGRIQGASAPLAAGAIAASIAAGRVDPSGAGAAAAAVLGGRVTERPVIGEARRPKSEPRGTQQAALALVGALALVLIVAAGARIRDVPAQPAPLATVARSDVLAFGYVSPWHVDRSTVTGATALVAGAGASRAIALSSGVATLAAGTLAQSAVYPGGVPPALARTLGTPSLPGEAAIAGHPVMRYAWTLASGEHVVAFVLPTATDDLTVVCAARLAGALASCERLARAAQVSAVRLVAPGPLTALAEALSRRLEPAAVARAGLGRSAAAPLGRRAGPESAAAAADGAAAAGLLAIATPKRDRTAVAAAAAALRAESAGLGELAAAAGAGNAARYRAATEIVERTSRQVAATVAALRARDLSVPSLAALAIAPPPAAVAPRRVSGARTAKKPATSRSKATSPDAAAKTHRTTPGGKRTTPAARSTTPIVRNTTPVVRNTTPVVRSPAPVVRSTAPVVRSTPPAVTSKPPAVTSKPPASSPSSSQPPSHATTTQPAPTKVVVRVSGQSTTNQSKIPGGAVVVPAG